jgi:dTDP-4-dehydrorhamnose reductase
MSEGIACLGTGRSPTDSLVTFDVASDRLLNCLPEGYFENSEETWLIHCISFGPIEACFHHAEESWTVNATGPQRVVEELQALNVRHVFLSTNQVFDGERPPYTEEDPPRPLHEYGEQKLAMERFLLAHSPGALVLRLDKVVSNQRGDGQLFDQWLSAVEAGRPIGCLAGQQLAPTLVSDVAEAILTVCRGRLSGLYHVANPEVLERRRLAELFLEVMQYPGEIRMVSEKDLHLSEPRPRSAVLDPSKFLAATGMKFTSPRAMLEQFRDA